MFLQGLHPIAAAGLIAVGCVFLLQGWKMFKILVAVDALALGIVLGASIGARMERANMDVWLGIAGGIVLAGLVWPLMKGAVSLLGALGGACVGHVLWRYAATAGGYQTLAQHAWVGALVGLIAMGLLAFVLFRTSVIVAMALQGAALAVSGICALMFRIESPQLPLLERMAENVFLLPLMVLVPGILGIIFQETRFLQAQSKKRKAAMARSHS